MRMRRLILTAVVAALATYAVATYQHARTVDKAYLCGSLGGAIEEGSAPKPVLARYEREGCTAFAPAYPMPEVAGE